LNTGKNILICPLEWGLGHAARMIPIARKLRELNNNVLVASGEEHLSMFRMEFPGIACINFPGFKPAYSRHFPQYIFLLLKIPVLIWHIFREHFRLKKLIAENNIDIVISDNRFGLWNRNIISVYVTHMPLIPLPKKLRFLEPVGVALHRMIMNKYTFCLIPDLPGELNLSGRLSHGLKLPGNVRFIGILSRFIGTGKSIVKNEPPFAYAVILSGPEPQKEILKQKLISIFKEREFMTIILEGKPGAGTVTRNSGNITFCSHLPSQDIKDIIESSENIITRSGYTTIMELVSLGRSALIIPTPGQTEQEYLAEYLSGKEWFETISQNDIKRDFSSAKMQLMPAELINAQSLILSETALKEILDEHHGKS
jgi:spore coat polysaccharide biosynthesis predicted glycosyltransferase SpsG